MKIVILSNQIETRNSRLQPYRTLIEMGLGLKALGHEVVVISNRNESSHGPEDEVSTLRVFRVKTTRLYRGRTNRELAAVLAQEKPDRIFWHLSLFSLFHQQLPTPFETPVVGVVTSPIHTPRQMLELGARKLATNLDLVAMHALGYSIPASRVQVAFQQGGLQGAITLSERTRAFLISKGAPAERIRIVSPGVGSEWLDYEAGDANRETLRERLGYLPQDVVIAYFGSPAPVRGLHSILQALAQAAELAPELKLLILSRKRKGEWVRETAMLNSRIIRLGLEERVQVIEGFLDEESLIGHILASDHVCLPFEIVPSDVPLSILEAMALKRVVISTSVASIPEILGGDRGFLVEPGSAEQLTSVLLQLAKNPGAAAEYADRAYGFVTAQRTWRAMQIELGAALEACVEN